MSQTTETQTRIAPPPLLTHPLHQHRTDADGRMVIAIHLDEPGESPDHTHPGYSPARPYDPGPVPPSAAAQTINALRREQAERELAQTRRTLEAVTAERERLARLAAALRAAVAGGWPLPPDCAAFAEALETEPT